MIIHQLNIYHDLFLSYKQNEELMAFPLKKMREKKKVEVKMKRESYEKEGNHVREKLMNLKEREKLMMNLERNVRREK